jgi:hypothetical protein
MSAGNVRVGEANNNIYFYVHDITGSKVFVGKIVDLEVLEDEKNNEIVSRYDEKMEILKISGRDYMKIGRRNGMTINMIKEL